MDFDIFFAEMLPIK